MRFFGVNRVGRTDLAVATAVAVGDRTATSRFMRSSQSLQEVDTCYNRDLLRPQPLKKWPVGGATSSFLLLYY